MTGMRWPVVDRRTAAMLALFLLSLLYAAFARAAEPSSVDGDRMHLLTSELRCLVCQNESLADSNAPLAMDLKNEIRTRMAEGDSDAQIKEFLVERYGDFVTYRPPVNARTLLLWLGPLLLVAGGAFVLWRGMRTAGGAAREEGDTSPGSDDREHHT